jgi:dUTP pyrophosphatase
MVDLLIQRLDAGLPLPASAHAGDAGIDLSSAVDIVLGHLERAAIPTGIALAIPDGYAAYVQPRSGLAARNGIGIVNSPGLIDSGYRGEVKVVLINLGAEKFEVRRGDKIAQLVVLAVPQATLVEVDELPPSARGEKGFGSTGR